MSNRRTQPSADRRLLRAALIAATTAWGIGAATAEPIPASPGATANQPSRIVSLNLCTDQLLLLLAPGRIAALSRLAIDPLLSVHADAARGHALVDADAEDVLRFDPDLIVAAPFAARTTVDLLRRLGRRVLVAELAQDIAGLKRTLRQIAGEIGVSARAEEIVVALEARLAAIAATSGQPAGAQTDQRPTAVVINIGGVPSGPGWLADAVLRQAGFRNGVADYPADGRGVIALEALVARPPDLLVLGQDAGDYLTVRADNLRHPALRALLRTVRHVRLAQNLTLCATPDVVLAIEQLAAHARRPALPGQALPTPARQPTRP